MGQESNLHSAKRAVYSRLVSPMTRPMQRVNRGIRTRLFRGHNPACFRYTMITMASLFRETRSTEQESNLPRAPCKGAALPMSYRS
jgi:hypothetical protein